jgi:DNA-binding response OmpR family regulator
LSGEDGLELIRRVKPDLVLLDIMLVGMDGWEILQRMQQDETMQTIPAIVMTARAGVSDVAVGLKVAGVDDYITKPFSPNELVTSINKILCGPDEN